jgi:hypothetical protein
MPVEVTMKGWNKLRKLPVKGHPKLDLKPA